MSEPRWTDAIPTANLRCLIANGKLCAKPSRLRQKNWAFVHDLFGIGSTHATELCIRAGIDPDATAGRG